MTRRKLVRTFGDIGINITPAGVWRFKEDGTKEPVDAFRKEGLEWSGYRSDNMAKYRPEISGKYTLDMDDMKKCKKYMPKKLWKKIMATFRYTTTSTNKQHSIFSFDGRARRRSNHFVPFDLLPSGVVFTGHLLGEDGCQFNLIEDEVLTLTEEEAELLDAIWMKLYDDLVPEKEKSAGGGAAGWTYEKKDSSYEVPGLGISIGAVARGEAKIGDRCSCPFEASHSDGKNGDGYGFVTDSLGVGCNSCQSIMYADSTLEGETIEAPEWDDLEEGEEQVEMTHEQRIEALGAPWWFKMSDVINTEAVLAFMENTAWRVSSSKFLWLSSSGNVREFSEKDAGIFWTSITNPSMEEEDYVMFEKVTNIEYDDLWKTIIRRMGNVVKREHQYEAVSYEVDPFGGNSIVWHDTELCITTNKLLAREPEKVDRPDLVADYKEHFPELDEVLAWVVAIRFGADRKQSYLWMNCTSDWGKSFLFGGVLGKERGALGIAVETTESELKSAMSGAPTGLTVGTFNASWVLFVDEFKSAISELKNITHHITISPKNKPRSTIGVYSKIFASAEGVSSLEGVHGADTQFINRFNKMEAEGSLVDRPLYQDNIAYYKAAIRWYCYEYINSLADTYMVLGDKYKAADKAVPVGREFYVNNKIVVDDLNVSMAEVTDQYQRLVTASLREGTGGAIANTKNKNFEIEVISDLWALSEKGVLLCLNLGKAKEHYIYTMYARDEHKKVGHKKPSQCLFNTTEKLVKTSVKIEGVKHNAWRE